MAEATDTKALLRVSGPCPSEPGSYPTSLLPGFDEAPNGHTDALVPALKWQKLFAAAGKLTRGKALNSQPVLRSVAVRVEREGHHVRGHRCLAEARGDDREQPREVPPQRPRSCARPVAMPTG